MKVCWRRSWTLSILFVLAIYRRALSEDDTQCLQAFKNSVKDPKGSLTSWNFRSGPPGYACSFYGVSCWNDQENKVLSLKLSKAGLSGSFPGGLSQCKALQNVDLSQNDFTGPIPNDVCTQIQYVTTLDLSQNSFSGPIPVELGACQYLISLYLEKNELSGGLPSSLSVLPRLNNLDVSSNSLSGPIPSSYNTDKFPASSFEGNPGLCGPPLGKSCSGGSSNTGLILGVSLAVAGVVAIVLAVVLFWVLRRKQKKDAVIFGDKHKWAKRIRAPKSVTVSLFEAPLVKLSFLDLMAATNDFDKENIIGTGRIGTLYKACLRDGSILAVKRLHPSAQSEKVFQSEMETLGTLRHKNLVSLLGYCIAGPERLLVYKHMVHGSLYEYLHEVPQESKPDWIGRLRIAIGAARGLAWLHHSCNPRIIHRNITTSSILLDEDYEPRITDFGLARLMNPVDTHVSTHVNGDFGDVGYVAPEYPKTLVATVKGDIYSFGVVLLELVTGQKANNTCTEGGFRGNLAEWASFLSRNGRVEEAQDVSLKGRGYDDELKQFLRIACACIVDTPKSRLAMYEVYQLLRAIGEKFDITDEDMPQYSDVRNAGDSAELIVVAEEEGEGE